MSQAGITKADKVAFLELHGWTKLPRKPGGRQYWEDPNGRRGGWHTETAYANAKLAELGGQ